MTEADIEIYSESEEHRLQMETEYAEYTLFMENDDLYEDDDTRMVQDEEDLACEREDAWEKYETVENEETDDDRID